MISVEKINQHGIGWANYQAIKDVILQFQINDSQISSSVIVDGKFPLQKIEVAGMSIRCQVDADATVLPVILAGIVAKVTRDRLMESLHQEFPVYGWDKNKGYGTLQHRGKIYSQGLSIHHRPAFIKVTNLL
jgi:ribonuclease HII